MVAAGQFRLLMVLNGERSKKWPDTPTLKELGYTYEFDSPFGLAGPKGIDPAIVKKLHDAFKKAYDEPRVAELFEKSCEIDVRVDVVFLDLHGSAKCSDCQSKLLLSLERRPVAEIERVANHRGARAPRDVGGCVAGTIIHHDYLIAPERSPDLLEHSGDPRSLVEGGDHQDPPHAAAPMLRHAIVT